MQHGFNIFANTCKSAFVCFTVLSVDWREIGELIPWRVGASNSIPSASGKLSSVSSGRVSG